MAHLLLNFTLGKYVFESNIKFAQVVLAKPIVIPTDAFQQRDPDNGHFKGDVPFWVQGLEDCGGRLPRVPECNDQVLNTVRPVRFRMDEG